MWAHMSSPLISFPTPSGAHSNNAPYPGSSRIHSIARFGGAWIRPPSKPRAASLACPWSVAFPPWPWPSSTCVWRISGSAKSQLLLLSHSGGAASAAWIGGSLLLLGARAVVVQLIVAMASREGAGKEMRVMDIMWA